MIIHVNVVFYCKCWAHIGKDIYCAECYKCEEEMLIAENFYFSTSI